MNNSLNEYLRFNFELNIELNHFLARFNVKMNNQNVPPTPRHEWDPPIPTPSSGNSNTVNDAPHNNHAQYTNILENGGRHKKANPISQRYEDPIPWYLCCNTKLDLLFCTIACIKYCSRYTKT